MQKKSAPEFSEISTASAVFDDSDVGKQDEFSPGSPLVEELSDTEKNANAQKIGVSRGGRTTKIHALVGDDCKPTALLISSGNINDCSVAVDLLALSPIAGKTILGDKAYATQEIMSYIKGEGATFCIPPKSNTKDPWDFDKEDYKNRNVVERFFNMLKQFRAVATRYDKLAKRYFGFVLLASIMILLK